MYRFNKDAFNEFIVSDFSVSLIDQAASIISTINTTANSIETSKTMQPRLSSFHGATSLDGTLATLRTKMNRLLDCMAYMCASMNLFSPTQRIQLATELTKSLRQYAFLMTFVHEHQKQHFLLHSKLTNSLTIKGIRKTSYHRKELTDYASRLSQYLTALDCLLSYFDGYVTSFYCNMLLICVFQEDVITSRTFTADPRDPKVMARSLM